MCIFRVLSFLEAHEMVQGVTYTDTHVLENHWSRADELSQVNVG